MARNIRDVHQSPLADPMLAMSAGWISGVKTVNKFGRNPDLDTDIEETIWTGGGIWTPPTQPRIHQIVSDSALDTSAGDGARTVRIWGLTEWGNVRETSEDVTMNGTTNVPTSNPYVIIHRMRVIQHGVTANNVGGITATADTDGTLTAEIVALLGQTEMAVYGVPTGQTSFVTQYHSNIRRKATTAFDSSLLVDTTPVSASPAALVKHNMGGQTTGSTFVNYEFKPYAKFVGPCLISVRSTVTSNNSEISGGFDLILVDNTVISQFKV